MRTSPSGAPVALLTSALAAAAGCGGVSPASGLTALMRASGAQYEPGELSTDTQQMLPTVDTIKSNNTRVFPGAQGRSVSGSVSGTASAVLIGLQGDNAHWLVPVGVPDLEMQGNFTFGSSLSFSPDLPMGDHALVFRGIDADGQQGPAQALTLKVESMVPTGALVIQLTWDTEADLDLHVRVPNATFDATDPKMLPYKNVWARGPLALPPKPSSEPPYTPAEIDAAGKLLFDSNAQCIIDGQLHEELVFPKTPPSGSYDVRVDAFSLCGEATARWHVTAIQDSGGANLLLAEAFGQAVDRDTVSSHAADSGTLAFTFEIP
jgi:hypothetical protein